MELAAGGRAGWVRQRLNADMVILAQRRLSAAWRRAAMPLHWPLYAVGIAGALITAVLRLVELSAPYWSDERLTVQTAGAGGRQFFQLLFFHAESPPLFLALLKGWMVVFGNSPAATGALSLGLMVAAAVVVFHLGAALFDRPVGVAASLLFWNSYLAIHFSTETRMYALVMLFSAGSTLAMHRFAASGRRRHLGWYLAAAVGGLYTHYQFLFLVLAQNVAALACLRHRRIAAARWWLGQLVLVASLLPWLPALLWWAGEHYSRGRDSWIEAAFPVLSWQFYFSVFHIFLYPTWTATWWTNQIAGWGIAAVLLALVVTIERQAGHWIILRWFSPPRPVVFLLALIGIPALLLVGLNIGVFRYYAVTGPLFAVVLGAAMVTISVRLHSALPAGLLLAAVVALNLLAVAEWRLPF